MSSAKVQLCIQIVSELFGPDVGDVVKYMCASKGCHLRDLSDHASASSMLAILYQHGFVSHENSRFQLDLDRILLCLRYPRYLYVVKSLVGNEAELLVEEILVGGRLISPHMLISRALKRLPMEKQLGSEKQQVSKLIAALLELDQRGFLLPFRESQDKDESNVDEEQISSEWLHVDPDQVLSNPKPATVTNVGVGINFERFHVEFRKQVILSSVTRRIDASAARLMEIILDELFTSKRPALSNVQIQALIRQSADEKGEAMLLLQQFPEQYVRVLEEDETRFLSRVGDEGGGTFTVNFKEVFLQFATAIVENIILEKFSSKALRIFRLVVGKHFVEESQIQGLVMIPSKEAKLLTYQLLENNFFQLQELKKSLSGNAPVKSFYLFHVDLNIVSRMCLDTCCKTLANMYKRRSYERESNRRLLEKQERVESIAANLTESNPSASKEELQMQLEEIQEMISPPERDLIKKVHNVLDRLSTALAQVDETLFILEAFLGQL